MDIRKSDSLRSQNPVDGTDRQHKENRNNSCRGCFYCGGKTEYVKCCNYYLITGKRRPCEAGDGCTVRLDVTKVRRKAMKVGNL